MNDVFAALMTPLRFRPGDPKPPKPKEPKPIKVPKVLTAAEQCRREKARRRPNAHLPEIPNPWGLRPVQCAVIGAIAEGTENVAVAKTLDISVKTVESHVQAVKASMGGVSRARAAVLWDRHIRGCTAPEMTQ